MNASFSLDRDNRKLFGVCSGLARWTGIDAMILRIAFVVSVLLGFGTPPLVYALIALLAD